MQVIDCAVGYLEGEEIYCEISSFQEATLIAALLDRPEQFGYAVERSEEVALDEQKLEDFFNVLAHFEIEDRVILCEQNFEEFFFDLKELELEDKIGVYFYNGAHDYRSQLLSLLMAKTFLADRALIVVSHTHSSSVHQAIWDFMAAHAECKILLDLKLPSHETNQFGDRIHVLSWDIDRDYNYPGSSSIEIRDDALIQSIYDLQFGSDRKILESIRQEALELQKRNDYRAAAEKYEQFLKWDDRDFQAWYNLGIVYYHLEDDRESFQALLHALKIDSERANLHYTFGFVCEKLERFSDAVTAYQRAIDLDKNYIDAYNNLGNLLYADCQFKLAEELYRQAIEIDSQHLGSYLNLGNVLIVQRKIDAAIETYQAALKLNPNYPELQNNLNLALEAQKNPEQFYLNLADTYYRQGQYQLAKVQYLQYIENHQGQVELYLSLFDCLRSLKQNEEAIEYLKQAISLYPQESKLYALLIVALREYGLIDESMALAKKARKLIDYSFEINLINSLLLPAIYRSKDEIKNYRDRFIQKLNELIETTALDTEIEQQEALKALGLHTNFYLAYQGQCDRDIQQQYGQFVGKIVAANYPQWIQNLPFPPLTKEGKIRIGYLSSHMGPKRLGELIVGWLRHSDREKFEIYCYYLGNKEDSLTHQFKNASDRFYKVTGSVDETCDRVIQDRLHILVFLDIGLNPKMTPLASLRLAPIQCTTWVHPVTSGLSTIDYFLSSDLMEPENGEQHYCEQLIRLPNIGICYREPIVPKLEKTRSDFGIDDDRIIYLACQSLFKYLPQHDYIFIEIVRQLPQAQFVFLSHPSPHTTEQFKQRLKLAFAKFNLDSEDYCTVLPRLSESDYLQVNQLSDIFLDSFSWSGGVTTLKAIACHLPVVTCPGEFMRGRHSYAILKMLGVTDTIADNAAEYIDIAVKLGRDDRWRRSIVNRMTNARDRLYDDRECITALEDFYQRIVREKLPQRD